jgi:hypothetical protein
VTALATAFVGALLLGLVLERSVVSEAPATPPVGTEAAAGSELGARDDEGTSSSSAGDRWGPWVPLFDGVSIDGWIRRGGGAGYRVEDGCIVGRTVPRDPNTFLCTPVEYGDFELEYEFKVHPELNSGVQIRSHSRATYRDGRVHGYQIEIDPSPRAWTAGLYEEGRRGWLQSPADDHPARKAFVADDWNRVRVVAEGRRIRTWLNDVPVVDFVDDAPEAEASGFIGLQVHGVGARVDPLEVRWRKMRIRSSGVAGP